MTILEQLAATDSSYVAEMIEARRQEPRPPAVVGWNNKSSWDNWAQKPKPFKKKTIYFRNR
ncbi:hypothetical protein JOF29_002578 [Kribbella aluminosa]|uniref:Uncharacterized protein n=1 Tax=Kribbella aluminosa TaxID=416017 RepID=A0ABS4UIR6_9ACTN|nr:hypothetical protein [Kribbella aluminosa]MBP2351495.1 hypothetical protein [Kribbella aluminosa]